MRNETFRRQLKTKLMTRTLQEGQIRWLRYLQRIGEENFVVYYLIYLNFNLFFKTPVFLVM